jgi:hypothetical protein
VFEWENQKYIKEAIKHYEAKTKTYRKQMKHLFFLNFIEITGVSK